MPLGKIISQGTSFRLYFPTERAKIQRFCLFSISEASEVLKWKKKYEKNFACAKTLTSKLFEMYVPGSNKVCRHKKGVTYTVSIALYIELGT